MTKAEDKSRVYCLVVMVVGGRYSKINSLCVQPTLKLPKCLYFSNMVMNYVYAIQEKKVVTTKKIQKRT